MRTLVVLAVMGLCSALPHQAYNSFPNHYQGSQHAGSYQPKWTGPLASSVPAGVNGQVTPVGDTSEVSAARSAFFNNYQKQLASVGGAAGYAAAPSHHAAPAYYHAAAPSYHHVAAPSYHHAAAPSYHHAAAPSYQHAPSHSPSAPSHNTIPHGQVRDTPEVAAAKAEFFQLFNQQGAAAAAAPDDSASYQGHYQGRHY